MSRNLPNEYQEVEYIESSGTQYIDTGVSYNNNIITELKITATNVNNSIFICQKKGWSWNQYGLQFFYNNIVSTLTSSATYLYNNVVLNEEFEIKIYPLLNKVFINNNAYNQQFNVSDNSNICLFDYSRASNNISRLHFCKIYNNETLVRNFVPCYRKSDSVIGLYDTVNDVFYTNAGSGTFAKGADIIDGYEYHIFRSNLIDGQQIKKVKIQLYDTNSTKKYKANLIDVL